MQFGGCDRGSLGGDPNCPIATSTRVLANPEPFGPRSSRRGRQPPAVWDAARSAPTPHLYSAWRTKHVPESRDFPSPWHGVKDGRTPSRHAAERRTRSTTADAPAGTRDLGAAAAAASTRRRNSGRTLDVDATPRFGVEWARRRGRPNRRRRGLALIRRSKVRGRLSAAVEARAMSSWYLESMRDRCCVVR